MAMGVVIAHDESESMEKRIEPSDSLNYRGVGRRLDDGTNMEDATKRNDETALAEVNVAVCDPQTSKTSISQA